MIQAVLFDLDGTLADTALDLGGALNTLLARHNLPAKSMDEIRTQASHGAAGLLKLGAGITPDHPDYAQWRTEYLDEYDSRCVRPAQQRTRWRADPPISSRTPS